MADGLLDGRRRDFMKSNAYIVLGIHIQKLGQVPGNGFPFPIRVRCQKDGLRAVCFLLQILDNGLPLAAVHILRHETVLNIHAQLLLGQIPEMALGRHDLVGRPQNPFDGLRLGR